MAIEFKLDAFEGPLDLLLLLIEKNKVDIYDIPIATITDQYMEYVKELPEEDMDTLSDFLVMASTLLDIKSRMLLPKEKENGEEIDPRQELVDRLIEYREYKMMSEELKAKYDDAGNRFYKNPTIPKEVLAYRVKPDIDELLQNVTLEKLSSIFEEVLSRHEESFDPQRKDFGTIKTDPVRISDKLTRMLHYGKRHKHFSFRDLLEQQKTKADVVVLFLACLELIRVGQITCEQNEIFGDIELSWNEDCDRVLTKEDIAQYD